MSKGAQKGFDPLKFQDIIVQSTHAIERYKIGIDSHKKFSLSKMKYSSKTNKSPRYLEGKILS